MFTGIVQAVGRVATVDTLPAGRRLHIDVGALATQRFDPGDSVAVNGACLTVVAFSDGRFAADVSPETLRATTLGGLAPGSAVNLELPMTLADPLGGHLVTGHVDGTGRVAELRREGGTAVLLVAVPAELLRYVARKGSVCIDGVSLTVNDVTAGRVLVTLVPHTLGNTIMQDYAVGTSVNIEVDLVARYVERLMGTV